MATEAMADGVTTHIMGTVITAVPHTTGGDITAPGIGKGSAFQRLSSCEGASVAISLIACIEIAAPCRIMSGGLTVLYLPIAPAGS